MSKRVLIVDDEVNIVISLEFLLEQAGYHVRVAHNGEDGLEKIATFEPDLVLLDVMMPRMNGCEVCSRVCENAVWQQFGVVAGLVQGLEQVLGIGHAHHARVAVGLDEADDRFPHRGF